MNAEQKLAILRAVECSPREIACHLADNDSDLPPETCSSLE